MPSSTHASRMLVSMAPPRRTRLLTEHDRAALRKFFRNPRVWFGLSVLLTVIVLALLAPWLAPTAPDDMDIALRLTAPDFSAAADWLGRDLNGGSVLTSMLYGARTSLYISFLTVAI